jgi:secondary thiamine-phosphate synthase enzyme
MKSLTVDTQQRVELVSITRPIADAVRDSGLTHGAVLVFVPHTTAAVTLNENADPDVLHDIRLALDRFAPDLDDFRHAEGNSQAHVRSSLVGCSLIVPVENGTLALGTWQGIYFCEFDGPRHRRVLLQFLGAECR